MASLKPGPHAHGLPRWQRRGLYASGVLMLSTGILWLAVHYLAGAGEGDLPHPAEAWLIRGHGLAAFAGLYMFGVVSAWHVPRGWRHWRRQRRTGAALCAAGALLALTGYALYYATPEAWRPAMGWLHAALGLAAALLLAVHRRGLRAVAAGARVRSPASPSSAGRPAP